MWPFRSQPACPIDDEYRKWVDGRFAWLLETLPLDPREVRVILPTEEFFPDPFENTFAAAKTMFARIAGYMGTDPDRFRLFGFTNYRPTHNGLGHHEHSGAAGLCVGDSGSPIAGDQPRIGIADTQLSDPMLLAATIAHEIGHDILLGRGIVTQDTQDHEPLTDLLTVAMGMGVFTANATMSDRGWTSGMWAGWHVSKHGYLDQRTLGYALAKLAQARGESEPDWATHVRPDVRAAMRQSLACLAVRRP